MAGIYIHIPFCKSRCIYCGFFSTTSLNKHREYVGALVNELDFRRDFLKGEVIDTIYFGGGTPSVLSASEIERVVTTIYNIYNVRAKAEVTLEGNPDDLSPAFLKDLMQVGINRLSIGVQTFDEQRLRFLHRRHTAEQAIRAVQDAQCAGFANISVDLMFGFPRQTLAEWQSDVQKALSLRVQHLSAYSLMYEEGTCLGEMLNAGEVEEVDEEISLQMYEYLMDAVSDAGFRHYELSNFALPGMESRHNSSYWHGIPYLGVGAGAHSYDGRNRCFNVESLDEYMKGCPPVVEVLTDHERYNEYVFTGLRTAEGLHLDDLEQRFSASCKDYCLCAAMPHIASGRMMREGGVLKLTRKGLFVSNDVMSDLMLVDA